MGEFGKDYPSKMIVVLLIQWFYYAVQVYIIIFTIKNRGFLVAKTLNIQGLD